MCLNFMYFTVELFKCLKSVYIVLWDDLKYILLCNLDDDVKQNEKYPYAYLIMFNVKIRLCIYNSLV